MHEKEPSKAVKKFSSQEVKKFFQAVKVRKKINGLEILLAPRAFNNSRILVITPKKSGNSPQRNRIRRRLKHIFYEENFYENAFDCVVIVSKDAINLSFDQLNKILSDVIQST